MNQPANSKKVYTVKPSELPVCCPGKHMASWNSHPRVYLEFDSSGEATCPYCGALYKLEKE